MIRIHCGLCLCLAWSPAVGAQAVDLSAGWAAGRTITATSSTTDTVNPDTPVSHETTWEVVSEDRGELTMVITARIDNPIPGLSALWPKLIVQSSGTVGPGVADTALQVDRNDMNRLMGGFLGEIDLDYEATEADMAYNACGLHAERALLPHTTKSPGESWVIGTVNCTLDQVEGDLATVHCSGERNRELMWWDDDLTSTRTLIVDTRAHLVKRCEHVLTVDRRILHAETGAVTGTQSWTSTEVYEASVTQPRRAGWLPTRFLWLCASFSAVLAFAIWRLRDRAKRRR